MINLEVIKPLLEDGYNKYCDRIEELIQERINFDGEAILDSYVVEQRVYVDSYCEKHKIDLVSVLTNGKVPKQQLGLSLIENEIMTMIEAKSRYDDEVKKVNISTRSFTNGVENAPWLALFGSPNNLQWFNRRTKEVISKLDPSNKWHDYIVGTIEDIRNDWVDPQSVKPNLSSYWKLMNIQVPDEAKDLVVKASGH